MKRTGLCLCAALLAAACSSAPKRPAELFVLYNTVEHQLHAADRETGHGSYTAALSMLKDAWRFAAASDRPVLRIRTALARGNTLDCLGRSEEALKIWQDAEEEAVAAGEQTLAAACRVYRLKAALTRGETGAETVRDAVRAELGPLKQDKLFTALAWTVISLAEKEMSLYADAEQSLKTALAIHDGGRYLEQAAYDWYLIASVRSVAGDYTGAQDALDAALSFDRRAENSFALGADWTAKGEVFLKMGDRIRAAAALRRAAEIYRAIDREEEAASVLRRIETL